MQKKLLTLLAAVAFSTLFLNAGPVDYVAVPSDPSSCISLNGEWSFKLIEGDDWSASSDFFNVDYDCSEWTRIPVPACWDALGLVTPRYKQPGLYNGLHKTDFSMPESWKGKHVFIWFEGVLMAYELWVNGQYVGKWESAHNASRLEITDYVKAGRNDVAVRVYTRPRGFEFDCHDDWCQVGINRDVTVYAVSDIHVKDLKVTSKVAESGSAAVSFDFSVQSFSGASSTAMIKGRILDGDGREVHSFTRSVSLPESEEIYEWTVDNPLLWTAETPDLYTLEYSICSGRKFSNVQNYSQKFGIREIRVDGVRLLLNNKPFKLRGVGFHETDCFKGKLITDEHMMEDFRLLKQGNVNFLRCSHYPRQQRFYDLCDSLGFYVMDEIPFGHGDYHLNDDRFGPDLLLRAEATVCADKNHPSIVAWSVGNENNMTPIGEAAGRKVKELDPSRPICYPMIGRYFDRQNYRIPDFIDIYAPHYPSLETLESYISRNDRPMILTEYCHSYGLALEDHDIFWNMIQNSESMVGGAIWHWADQGMITDAVYPGKFSRTDRVWLSETESFSLGGLNGADGIVYPTRDPLPNYYNMRHNYAQVRVLTDKLTLVPSGYMTASRMDIELENLYDFVNLRDKIECRWTISGIMRSKVEPIFEGVIYPDCPPQEKCTISIVADVEDRSEHNVIYLYLDFVDMDSGLTVNEAAIRITPEQQYKHLLTQAYEVKSDHSASDYISAFPVWRTGRKPTISEEMLLAGGKDKYVQKYLMLPSDVKGSDYVFSNDEITYRGSINATSSDGIMNVVFDMATDDGGYLITDAGLAMLLRKDIRYFQWLGKGPYASWPGKNTANLEGSHALQAGDLYFEGDRMGVDAVLCTDEKGNGIILISSCKNINFEETDEGVVVSFDPVISGVGWKFGMTRHACMSQDMGHVRGELAAIPVDAGKWSLIMEKIFREPQKIDKYSPFVSAYDIYLRKFSDVCRITGADASQYYKQIL